MEINEITIFVKVLQTGSFGKAAKALGVSKSTISARVRQLEQRLKAPLLQRTTRKLHPTHAGQAYFQDCVRALDILTSAEARLNQAQSAQQGLLRLTVPAGLAESLAPDILMEYSKKFPLVEVELLVTNRLVDLIGEGIDLAIRSGNSLKDSGLIARRMGTTEFGLYASPQYLKEKGFPRHPKNLTSHKLLKSTILNKQIILIKNREKFLVPVKGALRADNLPLLKKMSVLGGGIALLDSLNTVEEVKTGRLIRILPDWKAENHTLYLIYPSHKFVSPKLRGFIDTAIVVSQNYTNPEWSE